MPTPMPLAQPAKPDFISTESFHTQIFSHFAVADKIDRIFRDDIGRLFLRVHVETTTANLPHLRFHSNWPVERVYPSKNVAQDGEFVLVLDGSMAP